MRAAVVVAALVLAGCAGDAGEQPEDDVFDDFGDVEVDDESGVIRGVVIDETITPVVAATVKVLNQDLETKTNENGAFLFSDVAPGSHFLQISKLGYERVQTSVEVEAGIRSPPVVKVQLPRLPGSEPHFLSHSYTGYIGCSWKAANYVGGCNYFSLFGQEDSTIFIPLERQPHFYQNEIIWESTQSLGDGMVTIQWACAEGGGCSPNSNDHRTCNVRGPSPLVCRVDQEGGGGNSAYRGINGTNLGNDERGLYIRGYAHCAVCATDVMGVGLMLEQTFDEYTFFFYNFKPADDWLFVTQGEPVVPG